MTMSTGWAELEPSYVKLCASLGVDELRGVCTYRMSHHDCGDTIRRLYFSSMYGEDGHVVKAFCHNCNAKGRYRPRDYSLPRTMSILPAEESDEASPPPLPYQLCPLTDPVTPRSAFHYMNSYGIDPAIVDAKWSPELGRIVMPIVDRVSTGDGFYNSEYLGYIARALPGAPKHTAKYITASGNKPLRTWYGSPALAPALMGPGRSIVFTEDVLSAAVVGYAIPGTVGVPLFGLNIQPENILSRMRDFATHRHPVVWLDNDEPSVEPRERLAALLKVFGYKPGIVRNSPEPKKVQKHLIHKILQDSIGEA